MASEALGVAADWVCRIRTAARTLLTMDDKDPKRIFEGEALLRRMYRYGLLVRGGGGGGETGVWE